MNYRTAYIRRSRKGLRFKKRVAAVALLGFGTCMAMLLQQREPALPRAAHPAPARAAAPAPAATPVVLALAQAARPGPRRIYPYSIVPGGVHDRATLAAAILDDKAVAAHYAGIEVEKAHLVTLAKPRAVYVSYRKGDQVFWTAKKVTLAAGEEVLTDGVNELRARCGNRISDVPMLPVESRAPTEADMDAAVEVARDGDGQEGPLNVAYAPGADGAAHGGWALLSYPNGAGLLALNGGAPAALRGPVPQPGWFGPDRYPSARIGPPLQLSNGVTTDVPPNAPAAETPVSGSPAAPSTPADTAGPAPDQPPSGLPTGLDDTAQPPPDTEVKQPTIPDTLTPGTPPVETVKPAPDKSDVPEPATLWLSGIGIAALLLARRRGHGAGR